MLKIEKDLTSEPVTATTTEQKAVAGKEIPEAEKTTVETLHPGVLMHADDLHHVEVGGSMTFNLGNYESARFHVTLRAPCTKDTLEETYKWATEWVEQKMKHAAAEAKGQG